MMHDSTRTTSNPAADPREATEFLLSQVATTLLRIPFNDRTSGLHVRALHLKRRLDRSRTTSTSDDERRATRESVLALRSDAESWLDAAR
jgi:hypothetical protein